MAVLKNSPLTEQDVRDMVRLLGDVIASVGSITEKRRLLMTGLCELVQAPTWVWCMCNLDPDLPPSFVGFEHGGWDDGRFSHYLEAMNHPAMEAVSRGSSTELQQMGTHLTRTLRQMDPGSLMENSDAFPFWQRANIGTIMSSVRPMAGGGASAIGLYRELG